MSRNDSTFTIEEQTTEYVVIALIVGIVVGILSTLLATARFNRTNDKPLEDWE